MEKIMTNLSSSLPPGYAVFLRFGLRCSTEECLLEYEKTPAQFGQGEAKNQSLIC